MRKSVALLLILVFLIASCIMVAKPAFSSADIVEDSWASKASMKVARSGLGVDVVNDKIYAIGGCTISGFMPGVAGFVVLGYRDLEDLGAFVGTNEEYDPDANNWTIRASMPTPRILFATAVYQNKIYCIGGKTNTGYTEAIEVYDPITNTWEAKTPMPTARSDLTACVLNGKIYLLGGEPNGNLNEVYNPDTDSWSTKASIPFATWGPVGAVVEDKMYIIGSSKLQIYDPQNDSWSQGASPLVGAGYGAVVTTGVLAPKRIYVIYHKSSDYTSNNCVYDPESDSWTFGADFPTNRFNFGVAVVNDLLYAIGGHTYDVGRNGYVETVAVNEQYTPMGYGTIPPIVDVVLPEKQTYNSTNVSLVFTVNKPVNWTGYSLDGQDNVTVSGNTTLSELSNGLHNVTVYAKDSFENTGASETISFNVELPEPFPTLLVVASVITVAVIGAGLLFYFKKRRR
jgi:N-acetylneuraminic acid mutarotase